MGRESGVALVTGASRGIGPIIARDLARAGYRLVLTGRSRNEIETLAEELNAMAIPADLTDARQLEAMAAAAERAYGRIDVLVNNAGGDPRRGPGRPPPERGRPEAAERGHFTRRRGRPRCADGDPQGQGGDRGAARSWPVAEGGDGLVPGPRPGDEPRSGRERHDANCHRIPKGAAERLSENEPGRRQHAHDGRDNCLSRVDKYREE